MLLDQPRVSAQEGTEEPPYLAEYYNAWVGSPHADTTAEAFNHWNEETDQVVPVDCARCHSTPGYRDYVGADDTAFGSVENPAPLGTTITCDACHAPTATQLTSVTFPSGVELGDTGDSARCMVCHQGRASTDSVNAKLTELNLLETPDTPSADLRFINIHYYAAAATLYGGTARGGYQYDGQVYMGRNQHVEGYQTCADCHNPHTTEIRVEACANCHEDVESVDDLRDIRMNGSGVDFDGDGDDSEGIAGEIEGMQEILMTTMQAYASEVAGTALAYNANAYPYYFIDTNGNGTVDDDEATPANGYNAFTANLERAAYNYQVSIKDPGAFAHNPQYIIELLYDSISSLSAAMAEPVAEMEYIVRDAPMHFNPTVEAWRHWDAEGEVPGTCARCHSAQGLPVFIANGVNVAEPTANGLLCSTCHDSLSDFTVYAVNEVPFPSGARLSFGEGEEANLCLVCHQGRESTVSVNRAIGNLGDDEVSDTLAFRNVHYFAAGASLFGGEAQGAYQYADHDYNGRNMHAEDAPNTCTGCHRQHDGTIRTGECNDCHEDVEEQEDVLQIRMLEDVDLIDYDGDGNAEEPIRDEIMTMEDALLAGIQAYAANTIGTPIAYSPVAYPYFFIDTNTNGVADPEEMNNDNRYATWTPTLLRAAYNYQYSQKDPGDFAHNPDYIMQVLYDSLEAVGADVSAMTRPPVADGD
ncbi:MAG: cytochrome c3 family protein [Anaerolineae bacterium]